MEQWDAHNNSKITKEAHFVFNWSPGCFLHRIPLTLELEIAQSSSFWRLAACRKRAISSCRPTHNEVYKARTISTYQRSIIIYDCQDIFATWRTCRCSSSNMMDYSHSNFHYPGIHYEMNFGTDNLPILSSHRDLCNTVICHDIK